MGTEVAWRTAARAATWPLAPVLVAVLVAGTASAPIDSSAIPYVGAILACWVVGVFLTWRAFHQAAGWAFLGLGTAIAWSGFGDQADSPLLVVLGDSSFVWWFMFLALGLQFTPTSRPRSRLASVLPLTTIVSAVVFQLGALLRSTPAEGPRGLVSPWAVKGLAGPISGVASVAIIVLGLCLLGSV
jgi:hypothetical protein